MPGSTAWLIASPNKLSRRKTRKQPNSAQAELQMIPTRIVQMANCALSEKKLAIRRTHFCQASFRVSRLGQPALNSQLLSQFAHNLVRQQTLDRFLGQV